MIDFYTTSSALRRHVAELHASDDPIDDRALDARMELRVGSAESAASWVDLVLRYGHHRVNQADLPYSIFRELFRRLLPSPDELLVDLGSGYGRLALYGGLLRNARVHGIELVRERVDEALRVRDLWELSCMEVTWGNATVVEWPEASVYCVLNPFLPSVLPLAVERLREEARRRRILIASVSTSNLTFERQPWLIEVPEGGPQPSSALGLRLFESR